MPGSTRGFRHVELNFRGYSTHCQLVHEPRQGFARRAAADLSERRQCTLLFRHRRRADDGGEQVRGGGLRQPEGRDGAERGHAHGDAGVLQGGTHGLLGPGVAEREHRAKRCDAYFRGARRAGLRERQAGSTLQAEPADGIGNRNLNGRRTRTEQRLDNTRERDARDGRVADHRAEMAAIHAVQD